CRDRQRRLVLLLSLSGGMRAERNCWNAWILQFEPILVGFAWDRQRQTFSSSRAAQSLLSLAWSSALPSPYAVGYSFVKISRTCHSLYFAELHAAPDRIAHSRESDRYSLVFQLPDERDQLIAGADVDVVHGAEVHKHMGHRWLGLND